MRGTAGKFLSPFMAVNFKALQQYICSVLFSILSSSKGFFKKQ